MESHFPHAPPLPNLLAFLFYFTPMCFWLVVVFEILIGSHLRPRRFLLLLSLPPQMMVWCPPHMFRPGRAPSPISFLPQTPTFGWLLRCLTKRWPPKAEVTSLSLIFDVLHFNAPNKGTNSNGSAPNAARLVWAHRDQRRQDVGPWRMLPWWKIAKPLEGRAMAAHVGYCVLCFLCFVLCSSGLLATGVVENWCRHKQNCWLLCNHNIKSTTKPPQCNDMYIILLVWEPYRCINILTEMQIWFCFDCTKKMVWLHKKIGALERDLARYST